MNQSSMRDALIAQAGALPAEAGLKMLHDLVEAENRRARRLAIWTLSVWVGWFFVIALSFFVYASAYQDPAAPARPQSAVVDVMVLGVSAVVILGVPLLPIAGSILLVLMVLARRSATTTQLRTSLGMIELQLKQLSAAQKPPAA